MNIDNSVLTLVKLIEGPLNNFNSLRIKRSPFNIIQEVFKINDSLRILVKERENLLHFIIRERKPKILRHLNKFAHSDLARVLLIVRLERLIDSNNASNTPRLHLRFHAPKKLFTLIVNLISHRPRVRKPRPRRLASRQVIVISFRRVRRCLWAIKRGVVGRDV